MEVAMMLNPNRNQSLLLLVRLCAFSQPFINVSFRDIFSRTRFEYDISDASE